jgi:peptide/nickel transport system substrate-binding protein
MTRLSRRETLRLMSFGAAAALLAACQTAAVPSSGPASTRPEQARPGGRLRIGRSDDLVTTDGMFFQSNTLGTTYGTVYERLIDYDDQLNPLPMLAESWQFSEDATQLKFKLRLGAQWHSGGAFTSADVKWSLERIADPKAGGGQWLRFSNWFRSIETPDASTVNLNLDAPRPTALDLFAQLNMVEQTAINGPNSGTTAVGTGPFSLQEWRQGESLTFNKNKNYWLVGRPLLDAIEISITNDAAALSVRLESGALEAISDPPLRDLARLKDDPNYGVVLTRPGFYSLGVNTFPPGANPLLADKRVRQALNMAIDRQRFGQSVLLGLSEPWNLPWPTYSEAYEPAKQSVTAFSLDNARALLDQAGVSSSEIDVMYRSTDNELSKFVQIYQADLAKIGITLNIKPLEAPAFASAQRSRQYQLQANSTASAQYHPNTLFYFDGGIGRYFGGVDQATVDAVSSETDPAKRRQLYSRMNDFILDQSLDMTFGQTQRALVFPKRVRGLSRGINQVTGYTNAWLAA